MDPATAARLLKGLTAPCGVFAIQGNHDFTFGWNNWSRELKQAGITVLEDQSALVTFKDGRQLQLSGILDTTRNVRKRLPKRQSPDIPHFLLSHRPETDRILSHGDVDIVISGHTHGGQVCPPFGLLRFEASPDHALPYTYPWHILRRQYLPDHQGAGDKHTPPPLQLPAGNLSAGTALTHSSR